MKIKNLIMIILINALILVHAAYLLADISNAGNLSAEEVKKKLEQMGLKYNEDDYRKAIKAGKKEAVELYLAGGMTPNIGGTYLDTPIMFDLAEGGMLEMVQLLIKAGADVNAISYNGRTALQAAASHGHGAIVYELIKAGAKITKEAKTAAEGKGYPDIVKMMEDAESGVLDEKLDINYLLVYAVEDKQCQEKAVADLIQKGADVNKRNPYGLTPLMIANRNNCNEVASMLLKAHAKVNEMDKFHRTVLMYACEKKNANIVRMLLDGGADANMKDDEGVSALIRAAKSGNNENVIELIKHGTQMNGGDSLLGRTALIWAAFYGQKDVVHDLLQAGANPDEKDYEGWTALHWAVYKGNGFLLKILSQISANVQVSPGVDKHVNIDEMNREAIVRELLDHGADMNAVSSTLGITPLMWAAFGGEDEIIEMLIKAGAHTNAKTKYYDMNPLVFAYLGGNVEIAQHLGASKSHKNSYENSNLSACVNPLLIELLRKVPWIDSHDEPYFDEDFIYDRLKRPALSALSRTADGILSLLEFMNNHPKINPQNLASFIKFENVKDKLDRNFWMSITRNLENTQDIVTSFASRLPYEERIKLEDIWIEWLNKVNSKNLKNENNAIWIIKHATDALYGIYDERLIPVYHSLLSKTAPNYLTKEPAEYLYRMGDPKSYERIASYLGSNTGTWSPLLNIADEENAVDYFKKFGTPNSQNIDKLPRNRPDLARGAIRHILNNPDYLAYLKNDSATSASAQKSILLEFISNGASVLKDEELIEWLHKAEQWKLPELMKLWIRIMENRDTETGNNELFKYATAECSSTIFNPDACRKLQSSAARALGKRLLGQHREGIIKQLESMAENKRAELVLHIMKSMNIFPCIPPEEGQSMPLCHSCFVNETSRMNCGSWCCVPPEPPHYYVHHDIAGEPLAPLLQKHEDKILDWIRWAPSSTDFSRIYGFMKSAEAERRFSNLVDSLSPSAIQFAWVYHKSISRNILNGLMQNFKDKEPYHTYLLFMLSEAGNDSAYQELKEAYYHKDQELTDADFRKRILKSSDSELFDELINESVRRHDYFAIREQAKYLITKLGMSKNKAASPTDEEEKRQLRFVLNPKQITVILTPLIISNAQQALNIIELMELKNSSLQEIILDACMQAHSIHSESILQKIASYFEPSNQSNSTTRRTEDMWRKWITALKVTNTAWCRDRIIKSANYTWNALYILADMGDKRALTLQISINGKMTNNIDPLSALKLGDPSGLKDYENCTWIQQQYEHYTTQPDFFNKPATPINVSEWKPEHIKNAQAVLLNQFQKLPLRVRFCTVYKTAATKTLWSDQLALQALNDSYAPVRLAMLQILLQYPRPSLTSEIKRIRDNDPMPWCRRFAKEILLFQPDPLYSDKGIYMPI